MAVWLSQHHSRISEIIASFSHLNTYFNFIIFMTNEYVTTYICDNKTVLDIPNTYIDTHMSQIH